MEFCCFSERHSGNESQNIDVYLDLARELKKLSKVTVILIISGTLGTDLNGLGEKRLEKSEIRERIEIIQATELLSSVIILSKVLDTCGDWLSLRLL